MGHYRRSYSKLRGQIECTFAAEALHTWFDAVAYCNGLADEGLEPAYLFEEEQGNRDEPGYNAKVTWKDPTSDGYRLPTYAEWEFPAMAGSLGEHRPLSDFAWHSANSNRQTQPVAQKKPNECGLYDILENVWEWV